jgi:TonB family protein
MFETNQTRKTTSMGTVVSLFLHASFVPVLFWAVRSPKLHQAAMRQLNIEVAEPLATRQIVEQQKRIVGTAKFEPAAKLQEQTEPQPKPAQLKMPHTEFADLKLVLSETPNESAISFSLPQAAAPVENSRGAGALARYGNSESEQRAQSARSQSNELGLINAYISMLTGLVNRHLIYPNELKKKKVEGVSFVTFAISETGAIQPNSLQIKKSSGSAVLDANAMKTILSLTPFPKPPREMTVSLGIEFAADL